MTSIASAGASDAAAIDHLLDRCFGPARHARTAYRLRYGVETSLCLVARDGDTLAGSIQLWPVRLREAGGRSHALTLLGPLAVAPDHRCEGLGSALLGQALARVVGPVVLIGDEPYYGRFGFTAARTQGWALPGPVDRARLLLKDGAHLPARATLEAITAGVRLAA